MSFTFKTKSKTRWSSVSSTYPKKVVGNSMINEIRDIQIKEYNIVDIVKADFGRKIIYAVVYRDGAVDVNNSYPIKDELKKLRFRYMMGFWRKEKPTEEDLKKLSEIVDVIVVPDLNWLQKLLKLGIVNVVLSTPYGPYDNKVCFMIFKKFPPREE